MIHVIDLDISEFGDLVTVLSFLTGYDLDDLLWKFKCADLQIIPVELPA